MKPTITFALLIIPFMCQSQKSAAANFGFGFLNVTELLTEKGEDSLTTKRKVLTTSIYKNGLKLTPKTVLVLFQEDKNIQRKYLAGKIMTPLGPVISLTGTVLGYMAIKGKSATAQVKYTHPETTAKYKIRNRAELGAGLSLLIGGIIMLETGNELVMRSSRRYNLRHVSPQTFPLPITVNFGLKPSGTFGLYVCF